MAAQNYGSKADTAKSARLPIIWNENASGDVAAKRFFLLRADSAVKPVGGLRWTGKSRWALDRDARGVIPEPKK